MTDPNSSRAPGSSRPWKVDMKHVVVRAANRTYGEPRGLSWRRAMRGDKPRGSTVLSPALTTLAAMTLCGSVAAAEPASPAAAPNEAAAARQEISIRRTGLSVALVLIVIAIVALILKIRQLEG